MWLTALRRSRAFSGCWILFHVGQGHGPIHLLLSSAAEVGFAWHGEEKGWVRAALPLSWLRGKGFGVLNLWIVKGTSQPLNSSHLRGRDKMLLRAIFCGRGVGTASFLVRPRRKKFRVDFAVVRMLMGICFGSVLFSPLFISGPAVGPLFCHPSRSGVFACS